MRRIYVTHEIFDEQPVDGRSRCAYLQNQPLQYTLILVAFLVEVLDLGLRFIKDGIEVLCARLQDFKSRFVEGGGLGTVCIGR